MFRSGPFSRWDRLRQIFAEGEFFPLLFTPDAVEGAATHELILRPVGNRSGASAAEIHGTC